MVRRGFEAFTTLAAWNDSKMSAGKYGYRSLGKQMVPMADGVRLATLVYLPSEDANGPFPTILVRTPYGISELIGTFWHYAARGYAVVLQAVRGIPRLGKMKVVILTARPSMVPEVEVLGIDGWVSKPVLPGDFLDAVAHVLFDQT